MPAVWRGPTGVGLRGPNDGFSSERSAKCNWNLDGDKSAEKTAFPVVKIPKGKDMKTHLRQLELGTASALYVRYVLL